jgi:hypothetical protein
VETWWRADGDYIPIISHPYIFFFFIWVLGVETKISPTILVRDIIL